MAKIRNRSRHLKLKVTVVALVLLVASFASAFEMREMLSSDLSQSIPMKCLKHVKKDERVLVLNAKGEGCEGTIQDAAQSPETSCNYNVNSPSCKVEDVRYLISEVQLNSFKFVKPISVAEREIPSIEKTSQNSVQWKTWQDFLKKSGFTVVSPPQIQEYRFSNGSMTSVVYNAMNKEKSQKAKSLLLLNVNNSSSHPFTDDSVHLGMVFELAGQAYALIEQGDDAQMYYFKSLYEITPVDVRQLDILVQSSD